MARSGGVQAAAACGRPLRTAPAGLVSAPPPRSVVRGEAVAQLRQRAGE